MGTTALSRAAFCGPVQIYARDSARPRPRRRVGDAGAGAGAGAFFFFVAAFFF